MFEFRSNPESMKYIGKPLQLSVEESYKSIEIMDALINNDTGINWGNYLRPE